MSWRYGVLCDLHNLNLRGRLPIFIRNFLQNRTFKVRLGNVFSTSFVQEEGYPQGSILSIVLFLVKVNSVKDHLRRTTPGSLFVDDLSVSCRSSDMASIDRRLQIVLNSLADWALHNGFKFSQAKTVCVHFSNRTGLHPDPSLTLNGAPIPVVPHFKFLGIYYDSRLNFKHHLDYVKKRCLKALNLIRVVFARGFGADRHTKLMLYRALVRSKLDYGCMVYGSARRSYLKTLDTIQNQGLRICIDAFRTSPASSLHIEACEMPLGLRWRKLSMQYAVKCLSNPENPVHDHLINPEFSHTFQARPFFIKSFSLRVMPHIRKSGIRPELIDTCAVNKFPPWLLRDACVDFSLAAHRKDSTPPAVFNALHQEFVHRHPDHVFIYTDGSKKDLKASCAAVVEDREYGKRISDNSSIFTAELHGIITALKLVQISSKQDFVICSDSMSVLQSIANEHVHNTLVQRILHECTMLHVKLKKRVMYSWLPSHVGIRGNELADARANRSLSRRVKPTMVPYSDYRPNCAKYAITKWSEIWLRDCNSKLFRAGARVGDNQPLQDSNKADSVIRRLRIGHTYHTHSYLIRGEPRPFCHTCRRTITVSHIMITCVRYRAVRARYYHVTSVKDLLDKVPTSAILSFLSDIGLIATI